MAYLVFSAAGVETERRALPDAPTKPLIIGRAPDCDIPVPDILLSRHHCQLERNAEGRWIVLDLGSKNGTYLAQRQISRHVLNDGDELRLGPRTRVGFYVGALEDNPMTPRAPARGMSARPVDPHEALAGTVSGFLLVEPDEAQAEPRFASAPRPQPKPLEPAAYRTEDVYGMLSELMSSSWDSIKEQASKPIVGERPLPRSAVPAQAKVTRKRAVDISLQAHAPAKAQAKGAGVERVSGAGVEEDDAAPEVNALHAEIAAQERAQSISDSIAGMVVVPQGDSTEAVEENSEHEAPTPVATTSVSGERTERAARPSLAARLKRNWRRPRRPGGIGRSASSRRQMLFAVVVFFLMTVFVVGWTTAVFLRPQRAERDEMPATSSVSQRPPRKALIRVIHRAPLREFPTAKAQAIDPLVLVRPRNVTLAVSAAE